MLEENWRCGSTPGVALKTPGLVSLFCGCATSQPLHVTIHMTDMLYLLWHSALLRR